PGTRPASALAADPVEPPAVLLLSPAGLARARAAVLDGDPEVAVGLAQLRGEANRALGDGPFTVTSKVRPAPGNDPHDYTSLSIYWWPNPQAPDGLPYLQRDGERNPEADDGTRYDAR